MRKSEYFDWLIASILLCPVLFIFYPGSAGDFLFDDYSVLSGLGLDGGIHSFQHWLYYVFSGASGPLGRPLAHISFTLNAQTWPAHPFWFKLTNILIHLGNGLLVFRFARLLQQKSPVFKDIQLPRYIPLIIMFWWLIQPVHPATIFPVAQRMAMLSALFVLCGLIAYVSYRAQLINGTRGQKIKASVIIVLCGILAVFSKENGALLPVLIGVVELTLFSADNTDKHSSSFKDWKVIFVVLPTVIILSYLVYAFFQPDSSLRDFSRWQRVMTQSRILWDYLLLLVPSIHVSGYFADNYPFFTEFSAQVAAWMGSIVLLSLTTFIARKKYPLAAFAWLFFITCHLLESTTLDLELYFEHRNYLAITGWGFLLVYSIFKLPRKIALGVSLVLLLLTVSITYYISNLWANSAVLAKNALLERPNSVRAHQILAKYWWRQKRPEQAKKHYKVLYSLHPDRAELLLQIFRADCVLGNIDKSYINQFYHQLKQTEQFRNSVAELQLLQQQILRFGCKNFSQNDYVHLLDKLLAHIRQSKQLDQPYKNNEIQNIYILKANFYARLNQVDKVVYYFNQAIDVQANNDITYLLANIYWHQGNAKKAKELLTRVYFHPQRKNIFSWLFPSLLIDPRVKQLEQVIQRKSN